MPEPISYGPLPTDPDRIRRAAFAITAAFEGAGYGAYQNYDAGIVSYGRFQFTLASGSLFDVLDKYLAVANSATAHALQEYYERVRDCDPGLRHDAQFESLLRQAAHEPAMQVAQDQVATERYWDLVQELSIEPRGIEKPLGQALVFDIAINHGPYHDMIGLAEEALGVPPKSKLQENGILEEDLMLKLAEVRRDRLYALADANDWPGLKPRGDFWVNVTRRGDWQLNGDIDGNIEIKPGLVIQIRNV